MCVCVCVCVYPKRVEWSRGRGKEKNQGGDERENTRTIQKIDNRIRTTWNLSTQHWMLENGG